MIKIFSPCKFLETGLLLFDWDHIITVIVLSIFHYHPSLILFQLDMASIRDQYDQQTGLKLNDSLKNLVKGDALYALLIMAKKEFKK